MKNIVSLLPNLKQSNCAFLAILAFLAIFSARILPAKTTSELDPWTYCKNQPNSLPLSVNYNLDESPCMGEVFDITLPNGYMVSTNNPLGVQWVGKRIKIAANATVHFDRNVLMSACDVLVGSNSKIIVEGNTTLTTNNTTFDGCTQMWTGIQIGAGASIQSSSSYFIHAMRALDFLLGYNQQGSSITSCHFLTNYTGIQVGTPFLDGVPFWLLAFTGNEFLGGDLLSPVSGLKASVGISFTNCPIGIVPSGNKFDGLRAGVLSKGNSFVLIWKCDFLNMIEANSWGGFGVTNNLSVMGIADCNFTNNQKRGVWSSSAKGLYVGNSVFNGQGEYGVFSEANVSPANIWIEKNTFYLKKATDISAIYHERSPSSSTVGATNRIILNKVYVFTDPLRINDMSLIDLNCLNNGMDQFPIRENLLSTDPRKSPMHGIFVRGNSSRLGIARNFLQFGGFPRPAAIVANLGIAVVNINGDLNRMDSNEVRSVLYPDPVDGKEEASSYIKCAIHNKLSPNFKICANITNSTYRGFHFEGDVDYCDFAVNKIGHHWHGLDCNSAGAFNNMGEQKWHENQWTSSYVGFGANYRDNSSPYKFRVDQAKPFNQPPSVNISGWFLPQPTGIDNSECVTASEAPGPMISDSDGKVMTGTYPASTAAGIWDAERELLLKLERHPELRPSGSPAKAYYDSKAGSSSLQFAQAQKLYENAFAFPSSLQSTLNGLFTQQKLMQDSVRILQEDPAATAMTKQALANRIKVNGEVMDIQLSQINAYRITNLVQAEAWNASLPSTTPFESNLKNVFTLSVKAAKGDSLTEADFNILRGIANSCPLTGGRAVFIAPYRLPHAESVRYLDEDYSDNACSGLRPNPRTVGQEASSMEVLLSPNPAIDILTVFLSKTLVGGTWQITDLNGQVVLSADVPLDALSFDVGLQSIAGGIYFLQLKEKNALVAVRKFVVLR